MNWLGGVGNWTTDRLDVETMLSQRLGRQAFLTGQAAR
jgi:hypothetical protein